MLLQGIQFLSVDALPTGKHVALGTRDGQYVDFIMRIFFIENKNRLNAFEFTLMTGQSHMHSHTQKIIKRRE